MARNFAAEKAAAAKKLSRARLKSFFDVMGSGSPMRVTKGSEYDHPYYKQQGKGPPDQYTQEQTMAASRAAQAFTYEDARGYASSQGLIVGGKFPNHGPAWTGNRMERRGPGTPYRVGTPTKTGKMSNQDLYDMLGHMQKNAQPKAPGNPVAMQMGSLGNREGYQDAMKDWPGPGSRRWGDARQMVQDGANYAAAAAYGEGRTARPSQVDVWEGVDRKPPKRESFARPSEGRQTADHIIAQEGGVYAKRGGALPGGVETLQREGKAQAGSRYRRKRSRSSVMTEQPTAGSLLGGGGGGVLG
jgi:hypothetical protein